MGLNWPLRGPKNLKRRPQGHFFIPCRSVRSSGPPGPLKHQEHPISINIFFCIFWGVGGLGAALLSKFIHMGSQSQGRAPPTRPIGPAPLEAQIKSFKTYTRGPWPRLFAPPKKYQTFFAETLFFFMFKGPRGPWGPHRSKVDGKISPASCFQNVWTTEMPFQTHFENFSFFSNRYF